MTPSLETNLKYVRLRGLGGCLKSSLIDILDKEFFTYLPGTTRTCYDMRSILDTDTNNVAIDSIISKYCQDKTAISTYRERGIDTMFITERSLMDYAFLNNNINPNVILDYEKIEKFENQLCENIEVIDFVIYLSDDKFIDYIMSKDDIRSKFYGNDPKLYKVTQYNYLKFLNKEPDYEIKNLEDYLCTTTDMMESLYDKIYER